MPLGEINSQALIGPLIRLGVEGFFLVIIRLLVPLTPQSFTDETVIRLLLNPLLNVTDTSVSFAPVPLGCEIMVVPACALHI